MGLERRKNVFNALASTSSTMTIFSTEWLQQYCHCCYYSIIYYYDFVNVSALAHELIYDHLVLMITYYRHSFSSRQVC